MFKFLLPSDRRVWLVMPIAAMLLFIGGSTAASAATVYFNFGGSNGTQNGQESTPYVTTAQFTSNVVAGDTVYITGTLSTTLEITGLVGTSANPTRVLQWPGQSRLSLTTSSGSGIDIVNTQYLELGGADVSGSIHGIFVHKTAGTSSNITLSDLSTKSTNTGSALQVSDTSTISISSVTSTNSLNSGISIDSGNSNVTVSSVTITNPAAIGIGTTSQTAGVTTMTIDSATVTGAGSVGIQCTNSSTGFSVTNSTVTGSGDVTSGKQDINIQDCDSTVIRGNVVRNASGAGIRASSSDNVVIDRNMSSGHTGANNPGISLPNSNSATVTNNVLYGNTLGLFTQATSVTVTGIVFSHNTVYNSSSAGVVYVEAAGGAITNTTFNYNIVYTGTDQNVNGFSGNGPAWNSASNYNLYYLNGSAAKMESNYTALSDWQTGQSIDASSSVADPLFTTTTSGSEDLSLQNTSPAIDAAVGSTLTTDYANATRPYGASGRNDKGAYENTAFIRSTSVSMAASASVSDAGVHTVTLIITDSTNPVTTTYAVATNTSGSEWLTTSGGTSTTPVYSTSKTWTHTNLAANTSYSYYFRIADSDQSTYLALSSAVSASTVLSAPTAVTLTASGATTLGVSWTAPSGTVSSYTVSVGDDVVADDTTTTGITGTSTTLTGLTAATTYYVKVRAVNSVGSGVYSAASSAATLQNPPATLTEPDAEAGTLTPFSATLSWAEVSGATGYVISYGIDSLATNLGTVTVDASGEVTATANVSTTLTGLTPSTLYYWKVATVTSSGTGSYSAIATFTTSVANLGIILMPDDEQKTNIRIVDVSGTQSVSFFAYGTSMNLKVDAVTADLNGDGMLEIITTVLGPSNAVAHVRIFDSTGTFIANLFPFGSSVRGGASIAVGDFNNDGVTDLAVVPYGNVASNTRTYDFSASLMSPTVLAWKFTYGAGLKSGSLLAAGDVTGDGADDLVVWNRGRNPNVQVLTFNDTTNALDQAGYVFPYGVSGLNTGVDLVLADLDGNETKEVVTVPTGGRTLANIQAYTYTTGSDGTAASVRRNMKRLTWIQGYQEQTAGTFNLASGDINNDGDDEIVIAPYAGLGGQVETYDYYNNQLNLIASSFPYGKDYARGVHVALGDFDSDQKAELVTSTQNGNAPNTRVYSYGSTGWTLDDWFMAFSDNARFGTRAGR